MLEFEKLTLSNGLRLILAPLPAYHSVTVIILCGAGSRYETKPTNGISHFLEHMFFKGTNKHPSTAEIGHILDSVGADYNAGTGKEATAYHIKAAANHLPLMVEMLADMLWNSKFDKAEIERERGVVIEEINLYEDTPPRRVYDIYERVLWGDQPLGWEIGGQKEVIRAVKRGDFLDYIGARYAPNNMVVAIAGDFERKAAVALARAYFGSHKSKKVRPFVPVVENQKKPALAVVYKKTDQAHLMVGLRALPLRSPDRYNAAILGTILGGGMSSRLSIQVREKRGLAYYIGAGHESYLDTGALTAAAGVDLRRIEEALKVILAEFVAMAQKKVASRELKKAKEYIKGRVILSWEDSRSVAYAYGADELFEGKIRSQEEYLRKIDEVTADDVLRVAKFLMTNAKLNLAVIGPFKDAARFEKILKV